MSPTPKQAALESLERALMAATDERAARELLAQNQDALGVLRAETGLEASVSRLSSALETLAGATGTEFAKARTRAIELLVALQEEPAAETASDEEEIQLDPATLAIVWPIFAREAHAQVRTLIEGGATLPAEEALTALHSLKGSAASLGFSQISQLARALEHAAEQQWPPARREPFSAGLAAISAALSRGDAGEAPQLEGLSALLATL